MTNLPEQTFEPIGELFVVKVQEREASKAGVLFPDLTKERLTRGEGKVDDEAATGVVVSAGAQCRYVRRGDVVVLQGSLSVFTHRGERLWFGRESVNVVGVQEDAAGKATKHCVTDWREHVVCRVGADEGCVRPGATVKANTGYYAFCPKCNPSRIWNKRCTRNAWSTSNKCPDCGKELPAWLPDRGAAVQEFECKPEGWAGLPLLPEDADA